MSFTPTPTPLDLFTSWFADAQASEPVDPNAMTLATVDPEGCPAIRVVLLKGYDADGFCFYTNTLSAKGTALSDNPNAAINFYWKSLGRQIRISGHVQPVTEAQADTYFASRPRGSQIGAWASQQSQTLPGGRETLIAAVKSVEQTYAGKDVPRPPHWSGYCLVPKRVEFWHNGESRLHDRGVYERQDDMTWSWRWLYP